jgi:hypothetical protein
MFQTHLADAKIKRYEAALQTIAAQETDLDALALDQALAARLRINQAQSQKSSKQRNYLVPIRQRDPSSVFTRPRPGPDIAPRDQPVSRNQGEHVIW